MVKLITKSNMNVKSMMRHGSIAVFTMFTIGYFFGMQNMMLAFPIALTSIALSKQNMYVRTFSKTIRLILVYWCIVTLSLIGSINSFLGIMINFTTIFLIGYFLTIGYNPTMYKPFLMLFVFTNFVELTPESLISALLAIAFGVIVVILSELLIIKSNNRNILNDTISKSLDIINEQIDNIIEGNYNEDLYKNHSKYMRDLCYKIYITRYRKSLTTNLGKVKFDFYISMERFNLYLKEFYYNEYKEKYKLYNLNEEEFVNFLYESSKESNNKISLDAEDINFFMCIKDQINSIKECAKGTVTIEDLSSNMKFLLESYRNISTEYKYINEIFNILRYIHKTIVELYNMDKKKMNKIYKEWERSDIERVKNLVKSNYKKGYIRMNFALRLSIVLTISLFVGDILEFYKIIWVSITIMSVMQPYYEDTLKRSKERLKGNLIGIILIIAVLSLTTTPIVPIIILIVSLYLTYAFNEYSKLSTFTTLASMSIASLSAPTGENAIYRIFYVLIGLLIVVLSNRYLFPYKLESGVKELIRKLLNYDKLLIEEIQGMKDNYNSKRMRDLIILSTLTAEKLNMRNLQLKNKEVEKVIEENNKLIIGIAYDILR